MWLKSPDANIYDKRLELDPIKPADYLLYKGVNTLDEYSFVNITIDLLNHKQASLRACNRLAESITHLLDYISKHNEYFGDTKLQRFQYHCLLPVLNVLAYYEPLAWHEVKTGADFSAVYELASHSRLLWNFSTRQLKRLGEQEKMSFPTIKKPRAGEAVLLKTFVPPSIPLATPIRVFEN